MAVRLILKNSTVEDKRPTSSQLDQGEISLNTNAAGPFLCCEDSEGNIQQIGGVKISDDAPGTPVRGTFWLNTVNEKLYIFDGQNWRAVAGSGGGGGGGGGIDTVIGGDGIDASQLGEIVTIDNDIDRNRGLEFVAGRTAVALGSGLSFDADGKVKAESTAMTYKGTVNLTSASVPGTPDVGDSYANIGSGDFSAEWIAATGEADPTTANPGDLVIWNGTKWTYVPTGSGGGGGTLPTDLSIGAHDANELEIDSSTGNDVVLPLVDEAADKCGLMSPDDKTKLDTVEAGAQANVNADWDADSGDAEILNKPAIPAAQVNSDWDADSGVAEILNKPDLDGFVEVAGDNMTGDLTLGTDKITLDATNGNITADGDVISGPNPSTATENIGTRITQGRIVVRNEPTEAIFTGVPNIAGSVATVEITADGSITAAGKVTSASTEASDSGTTLVTKDYIDSIPAGGVTQIVAGNNVTISPNDGTGVVTVNSTGGGTGAGVSSIIAGDGISVDQATGDVTITNTGGGGGGGGGTTKADIYGTAKASGNVTSDGILSNGLNASVTKTGTGVYAVSFLTDMPDDKYSVTIGGTSNNVTYSSQTVSGFTVETLDNSVTPNDFAFSFAVFDNEPAEIIVGSGTVANTNIYGTAKAWGLINGTTGDLTKGFGCTTSYVSAGTYQVTFDKPAADLNYTTLATSSSDKFTEAIPISQKTTTGFQIVLNKEGSRSDSSVNFTVHDNTPAEVALTTFGDVINYSGAAAWGDVASDGTLLGSLNSKVTKSGAGQYTITFDNALPSSNYSVTTGGDSAFTTCYGKTATEFKVNTKNSSGAAAADSPFSYAVHALNSLPPKGGTGTDSWGSVKADGTIESSFNVASVTKTGTGTYDVVFTTPMPSSSYAVNVSSTQFQDSPSNTSAISKTQNGFSVSVTYKGASTQVVYWDSSFAFTVNATNATLPSTISQEEADLIIDTIKGGGVAQKVAILADVKPSGTNAGAAVAGWQDRTLNTIVSDTGNLVTLANDKEFTLKAGTYLIEWSAPGFEIKKFQTKLTNVSSGTLEKLGSSQYILQTVNVVTRSFGSARVNITSDTTYKIEQYAEGAKGDQGLGVNADSGENEIYTQVTITDLAVLAAGGGGGGGDTVINYSGAAAWGNADPNGKLEGGLNIASVTRTAAGTYSVLFSSPMPDDKYALTFGGFGYYQELLGRTVNGFQYMAFNLAGVTSDRAASFAVHALNALPPKGGTGTDAWGRVAGGTGNLESSFNIASVTNTGRGEYSVVFTTPMPTSDYAISASAIGSPSNTPIVTPSNQTTTGFDITIYTQVASAWGTSNLDFSFQVNATNAKLPNSFSEEEIQSVVDLAQSGVTNPGASAWAVFDGNNGVTDTINQSLNVASCTRTAAGKYDVVFTTPMPSTAYSVQVTSTQLHNVVPTSSVTASGFSIETRTGDASNNLADSSRVSFTVFATNALPPKGGTGTDSWGSVQADGTIDASFNVASVTNTGTGVYDVVFTTPMPTANYAVTGSCKDSTDINMSFVVIDTLVSGFTYTTIRDNQTGINLPASFTVNATNATLPSTITQEEADLIIDTIKGDGVAQKVAILADVKPVGASGGSSVVGWQDRTLNTIQSDTGNLITLANDKEFTLKPGTYLIEWSAPAYMSKRHQTKLTNVTTGSTEQLSSSEYNPVINDSTSSQSRSFGSVRINIASDTTYKIEHYIQDGRTNEGLGVVGDNASGNDNIYTQVTITDLAVLAAGGGGGGTTTPGVRYQQGSWTANWMRGDQNNNGQLDTSNGMTFTRVGQLVTISVRRSGVLNVDGAGSMTNLPYPIEGDRASGVTADQTVFYNNAPDYISFRSPFAGRYARFTTTYVTDDTSFIPGNNATVTEDIQGTGGGGDIVYNGASAWGNVADDGTINGSFNIASVARESISGSDTGHYEVTFTTPMSNSNYAINVQAKASSATSSAEAVTATVRSQTTTGFKYTTTKDSGRVNSHASFAVHSENAIAPQSGVGADSWATVDKPSANGLCTVPASFNVASVTRTAKGRYDVLFTSPMPSSNYAVNATVFRAGTTTIEAPFIGAYNITATGFSLATNVGDFSAIDRDFSFTVHASSTVTPTYTWKRDGTTLKPANDGDDVEAGAATFAGSIETTSGSANESIGFYPNGGSVFNRSVTDNSASFINCFAVGVSKIRLACDGKVTASNVTFNLETDNVANFSADGEYTGPTLDVKALLLTLQTAAARIETLEAKVQTLEGGGGY